jgi:hypothetical protein
MKTNFAFLVMAAVGLAACAMPFQAPSDVAHIRLDRADSPLVSVEKAWLERKHGRLFVTGYVLKRHETEDTTGTHLDVALFDATGRELRRSIEHFEPRQIPRRYRRPDYATYRVVLDPLPPGTARIEVRAHEGNHS